MSYVVWNVSDIWKRNEIGGKLFKNSIQSTYYYYSIVRGNGVHGVRAKYSSAAFKLKLHFRQLKIISGH